MYTNESILIVGFHQITFTLIDITESPNTLTAEMLGDFSQPCAFYDSMVDILFFYLSNYKKNPAMFLLLSELVDDCSIHYNKYSFQQYQDHVSKYYPISFSSLEYYGDNHEVSPSDSLYKKSLADIIWEHIENLLHL